METLVIDTVIEDDFLKIPRKYRNKRVKVIIIDSEEKEREKKKPPRKLNFKIDETLDDVVPFSDIKDTKEFAKELRETHWVKDSRCHHCVYSKISWYPVVYL